MTLNAIAAVCADTTFQSQVRVAAVFYAHTALVASHTAHASADLKTYAMAASTIADGCVANLTRFVWSIATSGAGTFALNDSGNTNDAMISSAMVSQWAIIAGVTGADLGN